MHRLVVLLTSCALDLPHAERFVASFDAFNREALPLYVVVPDTDVDSFRTALGASAEILPQSLLAADLVGPTDDGDAGNQKIARLAFGGLGLATTYVCTDSGVVFLRPFGPADFLAHGEVPYAFGTEDAELRVDPDEFREQGREREQMLVALRRRLGLPERPYRACTGLAVLSSAVVARLRDHLAAEGMTLAQALDACPDEFSWYAFWLERDRSIEIVPREPIVKYLVTPGQRLEYSLKGVNLDDIARGYIGVAIGPGFSRQRELVPGDEPVHRMVARRFPMRVIARALALRSLRTAPRVQRMLGLKAVG